MMDTAQRAGAARIVTRLNRSLRYRFLYPLCGNLLFPITKQTGDASNKIPDLKYTKTEENGTAYHDELATIKFRYKKPDGDKSIEMVNVVENRSIPLNSASDDFKFSAAVAWFGLKLRDSELIPNKSSNDIKKLAKEGLYNDEEGYKAEFIRLVESVK